MKKGKITASMMCASLDKIFYYLTEFKESNIEFLHLDIMDGEFVPNFGLGVDYIRGIRELTSIPLDLHLMIKDPEYKLQWIGIKKGDITEVPENVVCIERTGNAYDLAKIYTISTIF